MGRKDAENSDINKIRDSWASPFTIQQLRYVVENAENPEQALLEIEKGREADLAFLDRNARINDRNAWIRRKLIEKAIATPGPNRIKPFLLPFLFAEWLSNLVGASGAQIAKRAPGTRWLQIVDFLCSPTTVEQVFEPLVADWRKEYFDALHMGRGLKARWISVRYYWSIIQALGLSKVFSLLRSFTSAKK